MLDFLKDYLKNNRILSILVVVSLLLLILGMFNSNKTKDIFNYIKDRWKSDKSEVISKIEKDRDEYKTKNEELQKELNILVATKIRIEREKKQLKIELETTNKNIESIKNKQIIKTGDIREVSKILNNLNYPNNIHPCN